MCRSKPTQKCEESGCDEWVRCNDFKPYCADHCPWNVSFEDD